MPTLDDLRLNRRAEFDQKVGAHLRVLRLRAGLTQEQLAVRADMSSSWLSRIENGKRAIDLRQALMVCQVLNCKIGHLTHNLW